MLAVVAPFVLVLVITVTLTAVLMISRYRKGVSVTTAVVSMALCQQTRRRESAESCAPLALAGQEAERQWNNDSEGADDGDDRGTYTADRLMDSASWVAERCADFFGDHEATPP